MRSRLAAMAGQPTRRKSAIARTIPATKSATRAARPRERAKDPASSAAPSPSGVGTLGESVATARTLGVRRQARLQEGGELLREREVDVFLHGVKLLNLAHVQSFLRIRDDFLNQDLRRRGAGGQAEDPDPLEPLQPDVLGPLDQIRGNAVGPGHFAKAQGVRA